MVDALDTSLIPNLPYAETLALAGQVANQAATENVFADYLSRIARQTIRRQAADLTLFAAYLDAAQPGLGQPIARFAEAIRWGAIQDEPVHTNAWQGMTWGLVAGFVQWQLQQGYAVGSVNVRLATIKVYCALAHQAGAISAQEYMQIQLVRGYGQKQARKVDEKRETSRRGNKKAEAVSLTKEQVDKLKDQPNTPQGRRDRVLMCLLLDHGLRCGEIVGLHTTDFSLQDNTFTFYREKVDKVQTHRLTWDTLRALRDYLEQDSPPATGSLLRGSRRGGRLTGNMSGRAINERVGLLGRAVDARGLSPHDCRHYWATRAARQGTNPFALQEAGGWNSLAMPRRYVETARIANEGVKL